MRAKLIFFAAAAAAAIGSAALAGLIVAVAGLSAHLPAATLITLIAGVVTATFASVVAFASMAVGLFFNAPEPPPSSGSPAAPAAPAPDPAAEPRRAAAQHPKPAIKASSHSSQPSRPGS